MDNTKLKQVCKHCGGRGQFAKTVMVDFGNGEQDFVRCDHCTGMGVIYTERATAPAASASIDTPKIDLDYLLSDADAKHWADEYVKLNPTVDHGTMHTWFACAIMTGFDEANRRHERAAPAPVSAVPQYIPQNFTTHRSAWRDAITECINAETARGNIDQASYWEHELAAYDRSFARLLDNPESVRASLPSAGAPHPLADLLAEQKQMDPEIAAAIHSNMDSLYAAGAPVSEAEQALDHIAFHNYGEQPEDTAHLDCPHCGGSGHKDDVRPADVQELPALPIKTWRELYEAGGYNSVGDAMDANEKELRAALATAMRQPQGDDAREIVELWECALAEAAFYVEGHCADGSRHAAAIMSMKLPKVSAAKQAGKEPT